MNDQGLRELRRMVEKTLTCTGIVRRVLRVDTDPLTGHDTPVYEQVYQGPCLVYPSDYTAREKTPSTGTTIGVSQYAVTLPVGAQVARGDVFTATDSPLEPDLLDVPLRLVDVPFNAWEVATTCTAERIT